MAILRISFYIASLEFRNNGIENILCIRDFGGLIRLKHHKLILVSLNTIRYHPRGRPATLQDNRRRMMNFSW